MRDFFEITQMIVSTIAIFIAGFWTYKLYVQNRIGKYKILVENIELNVMKYDDISSYIRFKVLIKNIGTVMFKGSKAEIKIKQIFPLEDGFSVELYKGFDQMDMNTPKISWPMIYQREYNLSKDPIEIEPGESDEFIADFIVPSTIKVVEVYFFLVNNKKHGNIGWEFSKIFILKEDEKWDC